MPRKKDLEELLKSEKLKILKPNECGLIYDENRGIIYGICNKDGKFTVRRIKISTKKEK